MIATNKLFFPPCTFAPAGCHYRVLRQRSSTNIRLKQFRHTSTSPLARSLNGQVSGISGIQYSGNVASMSFFLEQTSSLSRCQKLFPRRTRRLFTFSAAFYTETFVNTQIESKYRLGEMRFLLQVERIAFIETRFDLDENRRLTLKTH